MLLPIDTVTNLAYYYYSLNGTSRPITFFSSNNRGWLHIATLTSLPTSIFENSPPPSKHPFFKHHNHGWFTLLFKEDVMVKTYLYCFSSAPKKKLPDMQRAPEVIQAEEKGVGNGMFIYTGRGSSLSRESVSQFLATEFVMCIERVMQVKPSTE